MANVTTTNQAESGIYRVHLYANVATYLGAAAMQTITGAPGGYNTVITQTGVTHILMPAATITDLNLRGRVVNASVTFGADEAQVYQRTIA